MEIRKKEQLLLSGFQLFLENATEMVFLKDKDLVYVEASHSFAQMVGKKRGRDLVGLTDFDIFEPSLAKKYTEDDRGVLVSGQPIVEYIEPLPDEDGRRSYSSTSKYPIRDEAGHIIGLYGVAYNVTAQIELEQERENNRLSRQMFDSVLEADLTEDRMLRVEGADWVMGLGMSEETAFSEATRAVASNFIHTDHRETFLEQFSLERLRREYHKDLQECTLTTYVQTGEEFRWIDFHSRIYHSRVSDTLRITTFLRDVDEEVRSKQRLEKRADTDALTGLCNRENVMRRIENCLTQEPLGQQCVMFFVDLDCFKQVNDRWGHKYGDTVLRLVADKLCNLFRGDDIFGRVGGDEFLVFLRHAPLRELVQERAKRVVEALTLVQEEGGEQITVTCSVGVAFGQYGEDTVSTLYEQADRAMYKAKELGRDQVFFADDFAE